MKNFKNLLKASLLGMAAVCLASCGDTVEGWNLKGTIENNANELTLKAGATMTSQESFENFNLKVKFQAAECAEASIKFATDGTSGYEVLIKNGPQDGSRKTGSLSHVRNLYRSLAEDGEWFDLEINVRGKNIAVAVNGTDVVCYTEPEKPFRTPENAKQLLGKGNAIIGVQAGQMLIKDLTVTALAADATNPNDTLPAIDEQTDGAIRMQQQDFPLIDMHVHLKGGLTKEQAHGMSMNYGINYGVAPNAGEGGVGRMLADDAEVRSYLQEVKPLPFLCGVQGEGRKWTQTFSQEALNEFDYLFTDAMTIIDAQGRNSRIYKPEEVHYDNGMDAYMDQIVDQTCLILENEPADIFANAFYLPEKDMNLEFDKYWTDERVNRVLDVMQKWDIALEISARYKIPSKRIIKMAKDRGMKFTFGTNNVDANFGRLEYCIECVNELGITKDMIWFPTMTKRPNHPVNIYNDFSKIKMQY
ncbi:MAG: DUF1080 domain-containing protein [Bacteroidaceae bacterium]|nr:DUF1080 domain-containing protein [Bacteroidaceae bacterium]